jgi:4-amino-4-deoxy-L-arabinose transferase-like glycosyltransferase
MDDALSTPPARSSLAVQRLLVLAAAALVFLTNLGGPGLWDEDEPKNATCAQEMLARGDWTVPTFNEHLRTDKPILIYWLLLSTYSLLGISETTARLPSALLSLGTILMTFEIGRTLFRPQVGLWGALVLATSLMFCVAARACTPDATLIFCTTLGLWFFARGIAALPQPGEISPRSLSALRLPLATQPAFYAALGLAVLAKGPAGVVLPTAVAVMFWIVWPAFASPSEPRAATWSGWIVASLRSIWSAIQPRKTLRAILAMRPFTALLVVGLIALPWYVAVWRATDGAWVMGFLGKHNVARFTSSLEGHSGPVFYYIVSIFISMLPWSLLLPMALKRSASTLSANPFAARGDCFLLVWAATYVAFFSIAQTKLPSYVLPCYPALALLVGRVVADWIANPATLSRRAMDSVLGLTVVAGVLLLIVVPIVAPIVLPGDRGLFAIVGLIPIAAGASAMWLTRRNRITQAATTFAAGSLLFAVTLFGGVAMAIDPYQNSKPVLSILREQSGDRFQLAVFDFFRPSLVFYAKKQVPAILEPAGVRDYLNQSPHNYLLTRDDEFHKIEAHLPDDVKILDRRRMFLRRRHDVLLLGRPAATIASLEEQTRQ